MRGEFYKFIDGGGYCIVTAWGVYAVGCRGGGERASTAIGLPPRSIVANRDRDPPLKPNRDRIITERIPRVALNRPYSIKRGRTCNANQTVLMTFSRGETGGKKKKKVIWLKTVQIKIRCPIITCIFPCNCYDRD